MKLPIHTWQCELCGAFYVAAPDANLLAGVKRFHQLRCLELHLARAEDLRRKASGSAPRLAGAKTA